MARALNPSSPITLRSKILTIFIVEKGLSIMQVISGNVAKSQYYSEGVRIEGLVTQLKQFDTFLRQTVCLQLCCTGNDIQLLQLKMRLHQKNLETGLSANHFCQEN